MVGCPTDDSTATVELRSYSKVYAEDIAEIETFMAEHFMTVDADYNVTFTKITGSTPGTPINTHPNLAFKTITQNGVDYKLYFIKLAEGLGNSDLNPENDRPTRLDSVFTAYKGHKTNLASFDEASSPIWFQLEQAIQGWREIIPEFKIGNAQLDNSTGLTTFSDFGAGVMFVPSGLAYFNQSQVNIPSYTPIIFNFKLMKLKYKDHDGDKIFSKDEFGGPTSGTALDTDGDGKPDYADFDDDNDGKLTKEEIRITSGVSSWYPYGALVDNPLTPLVDERNGIPSCSGDISSPNRVRRHLDSSCQ